MFRTSLSPFYKRCARTNGRSIRWLSATATIPVDVRAQLMTELKAAMKSKDTVKSTVIRSVLSEVHAADKAPGRAEPAPSSTIVSIIRKGLVRRTDSAAEFEKASRPDLAQKEKQEAELLQAFLPPLLPEADIDRVLREILAERPQLTQDANARKALGLVFKEFYTKVDRSSVDTDLVRARAEALLARPA